MAKNHDSVGSTPIRATESLWHSDAIGRHLSLKMMVMWVRLPPVLLEPEVLV